MIMKTQIIISRCYRSLLLTCVEFLRTAMKTQQVVDHGGLANTPGSKEQNHWFRGDLPICSEDITREGLREEEHKKSASQK